MNAIRDLPGESQKRPSYVNEKFLFWWMKWIAFGAIVGRLGEKSLN